MLNGEATPPKEATASLKEMSRDWVKEREVFITVNITAYSVASVFVLSLRFFGSGEVLGWKGKLLRWQWASTGSQIVEGVRAGWEESSGTGDIELLEPTLTSVLPGQCVDTVTEVTFR